MSRLALHVVAVVALLACAGCLGTVGDPGADPTPDTTVTSSTTDAPTTTTAEPTTTPPKTTDRDGHYREYEFRVREIVPRAIARDRVPGRDDLYSDQRRVADEAFGNGSARVVTVVHADTVDERDAVGPFEDGAYVRDDGTYYRTNATVLDRHESRGYEIDFEGPLTAEYHEDYDRGRREAVNYSSLSPTDRRVFEHVVPVDRDFDGSVVSGMQFWTFRDPTNRNESVLTDGDVHYVRYEGDLFRVRFDGDRPPVVRYEVRYEFVPVANSSEAFVEGRLDRLVTPLNESPAGTRDVLQRAIAESGFTWEGTHRTVPESYRGTEDWLASRPPDGRIAYVRHEGAIYRIYLYKVLE